MRPALDVMDAAYVVASAEELRPLLCDEAVWARWFPDLRLTCFSDRGAMGKRWVLSGALVGTCEVWLEQLSGGTTVHLFWQADRPGAAGAPVPRRERRRLEARYARRLRAEVAAVKDSFDVRRPAGELRSFPVPRDRVAATGRSAGAPRTAPEVGTEEDEGDGRADDE